ncbi:hypothetical protein B0O99DRAFT_684022 [Bisporella sp. PMI_857]|nr:hypothetical protein B0O99DRAFT_684022 [Bisporella sp. PMI_857]
MRTHRIASGIFLAALVFINTPFAHGLADEVFAAIDERNNGLRTVNREIFENPEIAYQEVHAHEVLTDFLETQGFNVTRSAHNISTAFRAEFSNGEGRTISFNSEYDALPGLGHACGHNLIATVGVAAAIGVKEALENLGVTGKVVLLGTPAEEGLGGKVKLLEAGAYDGLDCSLMAHPGNANYGSYGKTLASWRANVTWKGVAAHAAAAPFAGKNALDGFVAAYGMAGLYRQQLMASDRIHHVVKGDNSLVANVIPEKIDSEWGSILLASGNATATNVTITQTQDYWDQNPSFMLASTYYNYLMEYFDPSKNTTTADFAISTPEEERETGGASASSDQGNVSWFVPAIQVGFPIGGSAPVHNQGFRDVAGTDFAHEQAIKAAKVLALTGLEILQNETYSKAVRAEWEEMIAEIAL